MNERMGEDLHFLSSCRSQKQWFRLSIHDRYLSHLECLDVDILLHILCYCVIDNMFKALQEYVSRDKFVSN